MHDNPFKRRLIPVGAVSPSPPRWVVENLLPPGLTFVVGEPKTYKSTFIMEIAANLDMKRPIGDKVPAPKHNGSLIYLAAEQSPNRLRVLYQQIIGRRLGPKDENRWGLIFPRDCAEWQLEDCEELLAATRPTVLVLDPLVQFHTEDENDAAFAHKLKPLKSTALRLNSSVVVVHHVNKNKGDPSQRGPDWSRMRGTSALWGMADGGIQTRAMASGEVTLACTYKDHPSVEWRWRPAILERDAGGKNNSADREKSNGPKGSTQAARHVSRHRK